MSGFAKVVTDPVEALVAVGKENTELHEELVVVYAEVDLYRDALAAIAQIDASDPADGFRSAQICANAALSGLRLPGWATVRPNRGKPS